MPQREMRLAGLADLSSGADRPGADETQTEQLRTVRVHPRGTTPITHTHTWLKTVNTDDTLGA